MIFTLISTRLITTTANNNDINATIRYIEFNISTNL